jgi:hypothetical protein
VWRHSSFGSAPRRVFILIFFALIWLNPPSLRAFLKLKARVRSWRARRSMPDDGVHVWRGARARAQAVSPPEAASAETPARRAIFADPAPATSGPILAAAGAAHFREAVAHAPRDGA